MRTIAALYKNAVVGTGFAAAGGVPLALGMTVNGYWGRFPGWGEMIVAFLAVALGTVLVSGSWAATYGTIVYIGLGKLGLTNIVVLMVFGFLGGIGFCWLWYDPLDFGDELLLYGGSGVWAAGLFWYGAERLRIYG